MGPRAAGLRPPVTSAGRAPSAAASVLDAVAHVDAGGKTPETALWSPAATDKHKTFYHGEDNKQLTAARQVL